MLALNENYKIVFQKFIYLYLFIIITINNLCTILKHVLGILSLFSSKKMLNSFKQYFKILKVFFKQQKITHRLLDSTVTAVILTKF